MTLGNMSAGVLIVDDNPGKLIALGAALAGLDIEIVTATSGRGALHALLAQDFAVVLLDVNMPVMDGFETATMIRSRARSEHLPIIFITSEALADDFRLKGYELGAVDYIVSPVLPQILRAKVSTFADLYRLREQSYRYGDEMLKKNEEIARQNNELKRIQSHLNQLNESLEDKVQERTAALSAAILEARQKFEHFQLLFDRNADGILVVDHGGQICEANVVAAHLFGQPVEVLLGFPFGNPVTGAEAAEIVIPSRTHGAKDVEIRSVPITWKGKPAHLTSLRDITERKRAEAELRIAAITFETHEAIMIANADGEIIRVNQAFQDLTGYSAKDVMGKNPRILNSGRHGKEFFEKMWQELLDNGIWSGEIWDKRKDGQIHPMWQTITAVRDDRGKITEYVSISSDMTSRKQAETEINRLVFYDVLTGLPNRRFLMERLQVALAKSVRNDLYGALLFLDMDRFKVINDTMGHDCGDLMLIEVAARIQSCLRVTDTAARLGGDEFVVLIEEIDKGREEASMKVALIAEKVRASLSRVFHLNENEHHSSPSIGVSLYRGNEETAEVLLKYADMAMYQAKDSGRNSVHFFDPAMQLAVEARAALEADLRHAVPKGQLQLHYQIQLDNDALAVGAEGLVRWIHPTRGLVSPAQFIPIAEESSLILDIGMWVLETACRQLAAWAKAEQTRDLTLSVNVSAKQFRQPEFVEEVACVLRNHGVAASNLKLELTESVVLSDVNDVVVKMHALKALGVMLSMDDFGTGYSSLSYLKRLPIDQIKIDQTFVCDITSDSNDAVMVKTIIDMARNFGLNVIAEGVETQEQLDFLRENGCEAYQGYLFSKPVPIEAFEVLLKQNGRGSVATSA